jgi:two-component system sensor histidine kinase and response regulator WspE
MTELEDHARRTTETSHRLYREVIANRMRPFADGIQGFPRMVRDVARELGKDVHLEIHGPETLVDRDILDKIEAPLNHLLRNAVDHGIEAPADREKAGKQSAATIRLEATHRSGMLNITVADDGRGVDLEALRKTVVAKKLISEEMAAVLSDSELLDFLFLPNFSTKTSVTKVSGRGVGLDVVHNVVHEVRGMVRAQTKLGQGTRFEMQLPLTLSVMRALLTEISGEPYAFPLVTIDHVLRVPRESVKEVEGRQYFILKEKRIGIVSAHQILEKNPSETADDELPIIVLSDRLNQYGLIVERFLGIRDLVVQPLDSRLGKLRDISAAALLEDGAPVLIIDVEDMVRSMDALISGNRIKRIDQAVAEKEKAVKRILVADDSVTVREVERKMLSARGYEVDVTVDGMDAWNTVRSGNYDLVVTDVDMPRMDGIELVSLIRRDPKLNRLPVIIVSYKDREEDRNRGLEAGADYYLTKGSFQNDTFVQAVRDLIGGPEDEG